MSTLRDVVLILGDHDNNRIHLYVNALSRDYDLARIDNATIAELGLDELPVEILAAFICDLVVSQHSGNVYRLLVASQFLILGFTIAKHLIGRDFNIEFLGIFGGNSSENIAKLNSFDGPQFPVHYICESSTPLEIPSHWKICDLSVSEDTQAFVKFCETLKTSKDVAFPEFSYNPLFAIQNSRSKNTPVFCIPGAGDNIASFTAMCMALGAEQSVYGLQPRGLDGRMIPHHSVEAAAASYIEAIKKVQRNGAIHLVGHSFGGWIAFEIAAIIERRHDLELTVESITVIDSEVPATTKPGNEYSDRKIIENYIQSIEMYSKMRLSIQIDDWLAINAKERARRLHEAMVRIGILPARSTSEVLLGPYNTYSTAFRTLYYPRHSYTKELRLVHAPDIKLTPEQNQEECERIAQGWKKYTLDLKVFYGGGNHIKILSEPYISEVVDWWCSQNQKANAHSPAALFASSREKQGYAVT